MVLGRGTEGRRYVTAVQTAALVVTALSGQLVGAEGLLRSKPSSEYGVRFRVGGRVRVESKPRVMLILSMCAVRAPVGPCSCKYGVSTVRAGGAGTRAPRGG